MEVIIQFMSSSMPTTYSGVKDVYTKDGLLCLSFKHKIIKFPLCNVFSIESNYENKKSNGGPPWDEWQAPDTE